MYTDSIAEIKSREGEYFDEEHLHNMLNAHKRSSSARLI
jgi:serine phosphatase RsbU (regulator of sigma subunit)